MDVLFVNIGWFGVIAGTVLAFLAGWLWYSPLLLGKKWASDLGISLGSASDMPATAMVLQAGGLFLLSLLADRLSGTPVLFVLAIVAMLVFGFSTYLFSKRAIGASWIDIGYLAVAGLILGIVNAVL